MNATQSWLTLPAFVIALSGVAGVLTSALKEGIERVLPPSNRWHDLCFILLPTFFSLALVLGYTLTQPGPRSASDVFMAVLGALLAGGGANGTYLLHTRTGSSAGLTPWLNAGPTPPAGSGSLNAGTMLPGAGPTVPPAGPGP